MVRSDRSNTRSPRSGRRRRRPLGPVLAALLATAVCAAPAIGEPLSTRSAPRLDPRDPGGAWAGYSIEGAGGASTAPRALPAGALRGMDVSGHQGDVDWGKARADGAQFAYVKATEGTGFRNDHFGQQYNGSAGAGLVHGAYHFALPDRSPGAQQANFFVDNGGGWPADGRTLPGAVDMEHNPYGEVCYGMDPGAMSRWIADFSNTYRARTGRFPVIYTTANWWNRCTGGNPDFAPNNPLWVARYGPQIGPLPAGWAYHTVWQNSNNGPLPGGQDVFNGDIAQLTRFVS
ncbi:lysozyme [Saccharopolyspora rosea]|uniref:Lysozyme n=1 Tax=Saccharopolyspora rosea TaxID=524884 RepID=A0ABW3FQG9_9PSEU